MKRRLLMLLTAVVLVGAMLIPMAAPAGAQVLSKVICVPWQGDVSKYHTTWSGLNVQLKGVIKTSSTTTIYYKWVYGDGSESAVFSKTGATKYNVEINHVYTGADGTPFTARLVAADDNVLVTNRIEDTYLVKIEAATLDSKINVAIDNGLWYLYKQGSNTSSSFHTFDGSPFMVWSYGNYYSSPTASAVHAFQINGHLETEDKNQDPYAEYVELGLNWLFNGYYSTSSYPMLRAVNISLQNGNDPDTNGNGKGIEARDYGNNPVYQGGMVMDAIISSGTPDASSGRDFDGDGAGDTYREVVQDMCDMYAYGMNDTGNPAGGWRYSWNYGSSDNSISQWAAIGMIPAQEPPWNCTVPAWVKTLNNTAWLNYSYNSWTSGGVLYGGYGYDGKSPIWGYYAVTPSGMIQLSFSGSTTADPRWAPCERWLADNWTTGSNWLGQNNVYAYYALAKSMRLAQPNPVVTFSSNNFDWYRGSGATMGLAEKVANQLVSAGYWDYYGVNLGTAWSVIILRPVLFAAAPVACFDADPNPSYPDAPISFDPACSGHSEPGKGIANLTNFEWDWNNDGVFDESTPTPQVVTHSFPCVTIPCTYPVTLRVTDDSVPPRTATYVQNIEISNPPHPPVARAGGPYWVSVCPGDTLTLDGSASFDPDEGEHEAGCGACPVDTITAWEWDLDGAPYTYAGPSGATVPNAETYFPAAGAYDIGLRATDNTALAYPGSGQPNLSDEDFDVVYVFNSLFCDVTAVPMCLAVSLTWDDVAADQYDIYRSFVGPNTGFQYIGSTNTNSKIAGSFVMDKDHWYRIMAVKNGVEYLSKAVLVNGDPSLCNPTADANGPYQGCVDQAVTLDGSGSTALAGVIITWEWDLDNDGQYDDAFGETVEHTWNSPGTYTIGLQVTSSDSLVLTDTDSTTVTIQHCEAYLCPKEYRWSTLPGHPARYQWNPFPIVFNSWNQVRFINNGPGPATNVTARIVCAPINVTVVDGDVDFGSATILPGEMAWSVDDYALSTNMANPQPPNKGIIWEVSYDDVYGVRHVITNVPKFCGEPNNCP